VGSARKAGFGLSPGSVGDGLLTGDCLHGAADPSTKEAYVYVALQDP
jgi:hypothetical protein